MEGRELMNQHINSADGLRGAACIAVVLSHMVLTFFPFMHGGDVPNNSVEVFIFNSPFSFFYSGTAAVYIFFTLSGVVLTASFERSINKKHALISFIIKRYIRLMIPVLTSCVFGYLVFSNIHVDTSGVSSWAARLGTEDYNIYDSVISGLFGVFLNGGYSKYNWALWTMQIELFCSYLLILTIFTFSKFQFNNYLFIAIPLYLASVFFDNNHILTGASCFFFGAAIYKIDAKINENTLIALFPVGIYLSGCHFTSNSYSFIFSFTERKPQAQELAYVLSGIIITTCVIKSINLSSLFSSAKLIALGDISFSLYLIHLPIIYSVGIPLFNLIDKAINQYSVSAAISILISLLISIVISKAFHKLIDKQSVFASRKIPSILFKE
ncbi:acyltransferase family protein [Serratia marcescens]|uniref:acyltransferase family protein n=1 Tax=Serratia marcescens TaxID=615 RepID=UPI0009B4B93E|nr:acyltransferase [Serratia marcescens]